MEITIVIAILAVLATALLIVLNPKTQIEKSWDSKKKHELKTMQQSFEDFYNDKNCYPKPTEVCYNSTQPLGDGTSTCNICGNNSGSPDFSPYLNTLPCDPQSPAKEYLYQVNDQDCPSWYRIYTKLNNSSDPAITEAGCENGCGTAGSTPADYSYSYGLSSPNTDLEGILATACLENTGLDNDCYTACQGIGTGTCSNFGPPTNSIFIGYDDSNCTTTPQGCNDPLSCCNDPWGSQYGNFIKCACK